VIRELAAVVFIGVFAAVLVGTLVWSDYCDERAAQTLRRARRRDRAEP
jgi:hypothetical protein